MEEENIIKNINIKNYIKIFLLKKNIFTKIKIYYNNNNINKINNINNNKINNKINKMNNITNNDNNNTKKKYITNTILLNYIIHYYPELNYKINKTYVTISTKNDLDLNSKVQFKSCKSDILKNNPCKNFIYNSDSTSNSKISYDIVIGFNQDLQKSNSTLKLKTPLNLINIKCNSKNKEKEQSVSEITSQIEKLLKNNKYIKKYVAYIIVNKSNLN